MVFGTLADRRGGTDGFDLISNILLHQYRSANPVGPLSGKGRSQMNPQRLLNNIEEVLAAAIPAAVANTFLMEPLYAILMDHFHWEYTPTLDLDTSPPLVVAAPVSVRSTILNEHDYPDCVQWDAGYVAEIDGSISLQLPLDGEAMALCSDLYTSIDEDDVRPGQMLQRVAARLNSINWYDITNITDDFIVCLQDSHGAHDNQQDIDVCVPPDRIALLQSRELLWRWSSAPETEG